METNIKLMVVFTNMARALSDKLGKNLERLGMPHSIYPILAHLNEVEKAKTQKLGEKAVITSGTITHMVNKLVKLGYVTKFQDNVDKRVYWVKITNEGRVAFNKVHSAHIKYLNYLLEDIPDDDKHKIIDSMKYLGKVVERKREENI